jgi:hypothetical protein
MGCGVDCDRAISSSLARSSSFDEGFSDVDAPFFRRDFLVVLVFFCCWREVFFGASSIISAVFTGGGWTEGLTSIKSPLSSSSSSSVWLTTGFYKT